jgi:hypothetical protein
MVTTTTGIATSYIQFSRASLATVTNNVGNISWAGHNLLPNSESFNAASWQATSMSAFGSGSVANATSAPNGTSTADLCVPANANSTHTIWQTAVSSVNGVPYTTVLFVKPNGYTKLALVENELTGYYVSYDATGSGTVLTESNATGTITPLSDGWYRITHVSLAGGTSYRPQIFFLPASYTTGTYTSSWTPNGTSGMYLWGIALYRSDLGGMVFNPAQPAGLGTYYPTTPKNLLGYTQDFSNAAWTKSGLVTAGMANVTTAPDGTTTADQLIETAATAVHYAEQSAGATTAATNYTVSVAIKANGRQFATVSFTGATSTLWVAATFDLSGGGSVSNTGNGSSATYVSSSITSLGSGWFRCTVTGSLTSASTGVFTIQPSNSGTPTYSGYSVHSYTGDGTSGIYVWGAQLSNSASIDPYSPVYGAAVTSSAYYAPRLDFDAITLAAKGLLVEEQRTNLVLNSAAFDAASWTKTGLLAFGSGSTANAATAPDGTITADLITEDTSTGEHRVLALNAASAGTYTLSAYCKAANGLRNATIYLLSTTTGYIANADLSAGTVTGAAIGGGTGSASIISQGNGWYRLSVTFVSPGTVSASIGMAIGSSGDYIGNGTSGIYIWGAQLEAGSFSTSYIPTGASTVTRSPDVASVSTQAFPYSSTEGTVVVNASSPCIAAIANMITLDNGTTQERIRLLTDVASVKTIVTESNTTQANLSPGSATANTPFKFAVAYKVNDFAAVVNGSAAATDVAGNVPVVNIARLGADSSGNYLNGHIRQITYIPRRLTNAELQTRTT